MKKRIAILPIVVLICIASCGVKKNAGIAEKQDLLQIQGHVISQDMYADKPILGLLWQNDSLQITVNQGRQLDGYRASADTMYLYEGASDSLTNHTRQYSIYQPTQELLIIKYNDSLVYPIMPAAEPCEYPLDIEAVGIRPSKIDYRIFLGEMHLPWERYSGKHLRMCKAADYVSIDSTHILFIHLDGTWQTYTKDSLTNTGIIRRNYIPEYQTLYNNNFKELYAIDTTSIAGHIHRFREMPKRSELPWTPGEYYKSGLYRNIAFILTPAKKDNLNCMLFDDHTGGIFIEEGIYPCGWMQTKYLTKHKCRYE